MWLGDQDVSHKNGVKWSVTKKEPLPPSQASLQLHRAVEVLKKERELLLFGIGSNEAIICKSSQLYRLSSDMDVFGVPFGHGARVSHVGYDAKILIT